jgi:SAM-dependent methyltransferase
VAFVVEVRIETNIMIVDLNMHPDPTTRFSSRVDEYVRYRPSYPREVTALAGRECGLTAASQVADIGSGTGFLARLFLDAGCEVWGVEPNIEMRQAGENILRAYSRFHSVAGRAEATGLPDDSADLVIAGQAFHWFEPESARTEFRRILKQEGGVMLVWNERRLGPGFMADYEAAIAQYAPERPRVSPGQIAHFFRGGRWQEAQFSNEQRLDAAGLRGRLASSSYAPQPGTPEMEEAMQITDRLFARYQRQGEVTLLYDTLVYYGAWDDKPAR